MLLRDNVHGYQDRKFCGIVSANWFTPVPECNIDVK